MEEVRRLRQEKGWNQNELAFHADLAPSVISLLETGKREPNATTLRKLAKALEVRIPDLFEDSGSGKAQRSSPPEPLLTGLLKEERHPLTDKALDAVRQDEEKDARAMARLNASEGVLRNTAASGYAEDALRAELRMLTFDELFDKALLPLAQRAYRAEQLLERTAARVDSNRDKYKAAVDRIFADEMAERTARH